MLELPITVWQGSGVHITSSATLNSLQQHTGDLPEGKLRTILCGFGHRLLQPVNFVVQEHLHMLEYSVVCHMATLMHCIYWDSQ